MNTIQSFFVFLAFLFVPLLVASQELERAQGQILVQLAPQASFETLVRSLPKNRTLAGLSAARTLHSGANMHLFTFDETQVSGEKMLEMLRQSPLVQRVQFNHRMQYRGLDPDDLRYDQQWALRKIQAPDAWEVTTGGLTASGDTIVVAVMDGGCELDHDDLRENLWRNHAEIPNDGIDNDGNGYTDDYYGLRMTDKTDNHDNHAHGTRVAGIIGAKGNNNLGISGINWDMKLMILSEVSFEDQVVEAMFYAYDQRKKYNDSGGQEGAFVVACNYSLGVDGGDCVDAFPLWNPTLDSLGSEGILVVGATADQNWDVDEVGDVPTTCTSDFMIAVTNTDQMDQKVTSAAYGAKSIDLSAPGNGTVTTSPGNTYFDLFGGTSAAAPHVAGAIGLMYSYPCEGLAADALNQPESTARRIKEFLLGGVDVVESMVGRTVSNGRLNVNNSIKLLEGYYGAPKGPLGFVSVKPNPATANIDVLKISVSLPDFEEYELKIYSFNGQRIDNGRIPGLCTSPEIEINIEGLAPGMYFLVVENRENFASTRFMIR